MENALNASHPPCLKLTFIALCALGLASTVTAKPSKPVVVTDAPARILPTGWMLPDRLGTKYAWLDADHLAVSATIEGDQDTSSGLRRLMVINVRTGVQGNLLRSGFLTCANPHTGLVGAYVGDLRRMLRGQMFPEPVFQWFRWNAQSGRLDAQAEPVGGQWHREQCRAHEKEEDENGQVSTGAAPVRYLEPGHGQIRWTHDFEKMRAVDVRWENDGSRRALAIAAENVAPFVEWLPFRRSYLITAGAYINLRNQQARAYPIVTMDRQGRLAREPLTHEARTLLSRLQATQAWTLPARDGSFLVIPGRSHEGAGIYRVFAQQVRRLACVAPPGERRDSIPPHSEECFQDEPVKLSPDGCKVAFVSRHDFGGAYRPKSLQGEIHVLDACQTPVK